MDINRRNMDILFTSFNTRFRQAFGLAPNGWQSFSMVVPSGTSKNVYPFLEQFGGMREWDGDRQIKNVSSKKIEVTNRDFEDTVSVKRNDIEDDQYGLYADLIGEMGLNAGRLWQELAAAALVGSSKWFIDNKAFFATDHKYGASTISNKGTSALSDTNFNTAYQTMMEYEGHTGKALGVVPSLLVVGPKNRTTAWNILKNEFNYDATAKVQVQNVNKNLCDLLIMPELVGDYDDYWFLMDTRGIIKPVCVQQRQQPVLTKLDKDDDENVFMRKEFIYGTDARGEAFLPFPHLVYRSEL